MKKTRTIEQEYLECDGCQYLMNSKDPMIIVSVPFDVGLETKERPWAHVDFHFHTLANRHDCFRYWAHNPRIMEQSLKERNFGETEIEDFMELMLYREDKFHPGVEREKATK